MMQRAVSLVSLLVLGSAWTVRGVHVLPETLKLTQENFDLDRFMGRWYEIAVVSNCPHYMKRKSGNPVISSLDLQHVAAQTNFTMTSTRYRNDSCEQKSTDHALTFTPGRFFHHLARFGADVDSYVVQTNYDEYAMMLLQGVEKPSGTESTTAKLYSRTVDVTPAVLDKYKNLVTQLGLSEGEIIMNQNKGECVPGVPEKEPTDRPQIAVPM